MVFSVFDLDWFNFWFFYWVDSVLNTPTANTHNTFDLRLVDMILKCSTLTRIIKSFLNKRTNLFLVKSFYFRRSIYICLVLALSRVVDVRLMQSLICWKAYNFIYISFVKVKIKIVIFCSKKWAWSLIQIKSWKRKGQAFNPALNDDYKEAKLMGLAEE